MKLVERQMSAQDIPYEVWLKIALKLETPDIFRLGRALSSRQHILFSEDEVLHRYLCVRDFNLDGARMNIDYPWPWKRCHRALVILEKQLRNECRWVSPLRIDKSELHRYGGLLRINVFTRNDGRFHDKSISCVRLDFDGTFKLNIDGGDDEDDATDQKTYMADIEHSRIAHLNHLEQERLNAKIYGPSFPIDPTQPGYNQHVTILEEGLCIWTASSLDKCGYQLFYPLNKVIEVFERAKTVVEKEINDKKCFTDKILRQKLIMKYSINKPDFLQSHADQIWNNLRYHAQSAGLEFEHIELVVDDTKQTLIVCTLKRSAPVYKGDKFCVEESCNRQITRIYGVSSYDDYAPVDVTYCRRHQDLGPILSEKLEKIRYEQRQSEYIYYYDEPFLYDGHCNMPHQLLIECISDPRRPHETVLLDREYFAVRNFDTNGLKEDDDAEFNPRQRSNP